MADVFLSYASEDRDHAGRLARLLGETGASVWWDRHIPVGADFAESIERELLAAGSVVVCWSENSARSRWVRDEAAFAERIGKLVPILLSGEEPPLGFRQVQALDFRTWSGEADAPEFIALRAALARPAGVVASVTASAALTASQSPTARKRVSPRVLAAAVVVAAVVAVGAVFVLRRGPPETVQGEVAIAAFEAAESDRAEASRYADAFRQRLTDVGVANVPAGARGASRSEFILTGAVNRTQGERELVVHLIDRRSGATVWSSRGAPTEGAALEANTAAFALDCALKRRDPAKGVSLLSRYVYGCAAFIETDDSAGMYEAASQVRGIAPEDPRALGFFGVAAAAQSYAGANSDAEQRRYAAESAAVSARALAIDKTNADALFARCFGIPERDYARVEACLKPTVEADADGWALGRYSNFLFEVGRLDESLDFDRRAMVKRRMILLRLPTLLAGAGDLEGVRQYFREMRPFNPARVDALVPWIDAFFGDENAAEAALAAHPDIANAACIRLAIAARRKQKVDRADAVAKCGAGGPAVRVLTLAGDIDGAYAEIEAALRNSPDSLINLFPTMMAPVQRDPRFWPLAGRVGLVDYWLSSDRWPDFCKTSPPIDCRAEAEAERRARTGVASASAQ